jgi:hypothetical protein
MASWRRWRTNSGAHRSQGRRRRHRIQPGALPCCRDRRARCWTRTACRVQVACVDGPRELQSARVRRIGRAGGHGIGQRKATVILGRVVAAAAAGPHPRPGAGTVPESGPCRTACLPAGRIVHAGGGATRRETSLSNPMSGSRDHDPWSKGEPHPRERVAAGRTNGSASRGSSRLFAPFVAVAGS